MSAEVEATPYSVAEVAALTGLSASTVTKLFEKENGALDEARCSRFGI